MNVTRIIEFHIENAGDLTLGKEVPDLDSDSSPTTLSDQRSLSTLDHFPDELIDVHPNGPPVTSCLAPQSFS